MTPELQAWRQSGGHLPDILKDFHSQKALFQAMHAMLGEAGPNDVIRRPDWVEGQCYVIDSFLWFMARHGYTLQRSRAKQAFESLQANIEAVEKHQRTLPGMLFSKAQQSQMPESPEPLA